MAKKIISTSNKFIVHPGIALKEILENRKMTRQELSALTGTSEAYICDVINCKKAISAKFALKLEYVFGVDKTFWTTLQGRYDAFIEEDLDKNEISEAEIQVLYQLKSIYEDIFKEEINDNSIINDCVIKMRKKLMISNLLLLNKTYFSKEYDVSNVLNEDSLSLIATKRLYVIKEREDELNEKISIK